MNNLNTKERFALFLLEYKAICEKYSCMVSSCGCCQSPWLQDEVDLEDHIKHLKGQE